MGVCIAHASQARLTVVGGLQCFGRSIQSHCDLFAYVPWRRALSWRVASLLYRSAARRGSEIERWLVLARVRRAVRLPLGAAELRWSLMTSFDRTNGLVRSVCVARRCCARAPCVCVLCVLSDDSSSGSLIGLRQQARSGQSCYSAVTGSGYVRQSQLWLCCVHLAH